MFVIDIVFLKFFTLLDGQNAFLISYSEAYVIIRSISIYTKLKFWTSGLLFIIKHLKFKRAQNKT